MKKFKQLLYLLIITILLISLTSCKKQVYAFTQHETYYEFKNISYGNHKRQILDLSLPKNPSVNGLILFIHGGSWVSGDKEGYNGSIKYWCEINGYAAATINYHYINYRFNYEDLLNDITKSLSKIKSLAKEYNINLTKVMLTGNSAGAHLSLLYAYKEKDTAPITPSCVFSYCGPTDLTDENFYKDNKFNVKLIYLFSNLTGKTITPSNYKKKLNILEKASPIYYVSKNCVPTIICHGLKDDVVPYSNATRLSEKLNEYQIYNVLIPYPNSGHSLNDDEESSIKADQLMHDLANTYLK